MAQQAEENFEVRGSPFSTHLDKKADEGCTSLCKYIYKYKVEITKQAPLTFEM